MPRLTAEQLAARKHGMGATDVVEALGLSPYEGAGPMRLFMQKTSDDAEDESQDDKPWLDWGHRIEPLILEWYEHETGYKTVPGGQVQHREHPWLWATLDASVMGGDRNVEIKNMGSKMVRGWDAYEDDGVPRHVRAQVMIGMACTGKRLCDVAASVGGRPPHIWTVAWDEELGALLIDGARRFWDLVQTRVAPPLDATPATKEYLRRKYPVDEREIREATASEQGIGQERARNAEIEKSCHAEVSRLDAQLLQACADAKGIEGDGWRMTWKINKAGKRAQRFTVRGEE